MNAPVSTLPELELTRAHLLHLFERKYRRNGALAWGPRLRLEADYFSPDDYYEAMVEKLVTPGCAWADVGCGRDVFPSNRELARTLAQRCGYLFGIDPDPNIKDNGIISAGFNGLVEDCNPDRQFDLITMRMVAEHIVDPGRVLAKLAQMCRPHARVVVYTPNKWSPMSLAARITPFWLHNPLKRLLWDSQARDTFPTAYRMNTRADLDRLFTEHRFELIHFSYLDDCRIFGGYRTLNWVELRVRAAFNGFGLRHPENCLLAVFRKLDV